MRTPSPKASTEKLRGLSIYTGAKLASEPELKDLATLLEEGEAELALADTGIEAATRAALVQQALRDKADREADAKTRGVFNAARTVDGTSGGKAGPKQKSLFAKGLLGVTAVPLDEQPGAMMVLASLLAADADPTLSAHAPVITAAATKLKEAVDAYNAATQGVAVAWGQVMRARQAWIRLYEKVYGELVVRLGKRSAEAYFKAPKKLPKPQEPVLPTPPTPTPA